MTLEDLELPISLEEARGYALLFTEQLAQRLGELHAEHGSTNLIPMPFPLTNGKLMLCGDILTECVPGGLLADMWEAADKNILLPNVEVVPIEDALALMVERTDGPA